MLEGLIAIESGVLALLLESDGKKGSGQDEIPNMLIKWYAEWVSKYLVFIYNKCLDQSSVPTKWKIAKVVPTHKSDEHSLASNYGPISLTCTCCKLLEHIILKFMAAFIEEKQYLMYTSAWLQARIINSCAAS